MRSKPRIGRILLVSTMILLFGWSAFYLYQKQSSMYNYMSFALPDAEVSIFIPDMERVIGKVDQVEELEIDGLPDLLREGINSTLKQNNLKIDPAFGHECFITANKENFAIVFKTVDLTNDFTADYIKTIFQLETSISENALTVSGQKYYFNQLGYFTAISTIKLNPNKDALLPLPSNADYTVYSKSDSTGVHHILSRNYHFKVKSDKTSFIKGNAIHHRSLFERVPFEVDEIAFYGSSRLNDDANTIFNFSDSLNPNIYNWIDNGLIYFRKDSFELLIAGQNLDRDLKLILEEETLKRLGDSSQIQYFNISSFEIMPFKSQIKWETGIPELKSKLTCFSEYLNFNVLANSIPAMRWYISQLQLGNMLLANDLFVKDYENTVPLESNYIHFSKNEETEAIQWVSYVWSDSRGKMRTDVALNEQKIGSEELQILAEFPIEIIPGTITIVKDTVQILVSNKNQLVMYQDGKKLWRLDLSTDLVIPPQIVDLENDGKVEVVLFQANQMDLVDDLGHSLPGFPVMLGGNSRGGRAVNYDNNFDWRFLINVGNQVLSYNESGKKVDGWMFNGMTANLKDEITYYVAKGKDIISFSDQNNKQYVLSRRGDFRRQGEVYLKTHNTSPFILGNLENSSIRKLGYHESYIYNYYLLDGTKDSVKLDEEVNPQKVFWEFNNGQPHLIIEEKNRVVAFNEFGYQQTEVLKPNPASKFVGRMGLQDNRYVFSNNEQKNLYLLNTKGKMISNLPIKGTEIYAYHEGILYTFIGSEMIIYKID